MNFTPPKKQVLKNPLKKEKEPRNKNIIEKKLLDKLQNHQN